MIYCFLFQNSRIRAYGKNALLPFAKQAFFYRKELQNKLLQTSLENIGILVNTRSGYRRNKWMIAAECYIIWLLQINRSAFCYFLSLIAITQFWLKIQPVYGSFCHCRSKHTTFDWSLSGKMYWLTDRDMIYCSRLFVLNKEISCDGQHVSGEKGKSAAYRSSS